MLRFPDSSYDDENADLNCADSEKNQQGGMECRRRQSETFVIINNPFEPEGIDVNLSDLINKAIYEKIVDEDGNDCADGNDQQPFDRKEQKKHKSDYEKQWQNVVSYDDG